MYFEKGLFHPAEVQFERGPRADTAWDN